MVDTTIFKPTEEKIKKKVSFTKGKKKKKGSLADSKSTAEMRSIEHKIIEEDFNKEAKDKSQKN
jgi:hypothetical protein